MFKALIASRAIHRIRINFHTPSLPPSSSPLSNRLADLQRSILILYIPLSIDRIDLLSPLFSSNANPNLVDRILQNSVVVALLEVDRFEFPMKEKKSAKFNLQQQHQNGHFSPFNFAKLLDPEASWDKDQLGDVLHWIRQVVALVCGLLWGAMPLVGGIWIVVFLVISSGIIYGYYAIILKIDEEEFGGHGALLQEGLFVSIMLFLLAWTLVYSLAHF